MMIYPPTNMYSPHASVKRERNETKAQENSSVIMELLEAQGCI